MKNGEQNEKHVAQAELLKRWHTAVGAGENRFGWKIGLNDPRAQRYFGLNESVVGYMTEKSLIRESRHFDSSTMLVVEPELAIRIGKNIDPESSPAEIARSIDQVCPALEILNLEQPRRTLSDVMGHNIFHAGVVLGGWSHPEAAVGTFVELVKNGASVASARALQALPPLDRVVKLVAQTLSDHDEALHGGDVIISGSMTPQIPLEPGHAILAAFSGLGCLNLERDKLGHVQFSEIPIS